VTKDAVPMVTWMLKLQCTNIERLTPPLIKEKAPFLKHVHVQKIIKIIVMDIKESEARNDCVGDGQQQFN
jgi:hypothetical protein